MHKVCIGTPLFLLVRLFLLSDFVTGQIKFGSIRPAMALPDWLSYVRKPEEEQNPRQANLQMRKMLNEISAVVDQKGFLPEYRDKIKSATQPDDSLYIAEPMVNYYNTFVATQDKSAFDVDGLTRFKEAPFNTTEEKVMIFTVIRIIADYLLKSKEIGVNYAEEARGRGFLDFHFDIPDDDLIPAYYLMRYVNDEAYEAQRKKDKDRAKRGQRRVVDEH